jgi:hypothetical protein
MRLNLEFLIGIIVFPVLHEECLFVIKDNGGNDEERGKDD